VSLATELNRVFYWLVDNDIHYYFWLNYVFIHKLFLGFALLHFLHFEVINFIVIK